MQGMKMGYGRRISIIAKGSNKDGYGQFNRSKRVAISWPTDLLAKLIAEAIDCGMPFSEIVRRRVRKGYE